MICRGLRARQKKKADESQAGSFFVNRENEAHLKYYSLRKSLDVLVINRVGFKQGQIVRALPKKPTRMQKEVVQFK